MTLINTQCDLGGYYIWPMGVQHHYLAFDSARRLSMKVNVIRQTDRQTLIVNGRPCMLSPGVPVLPWYPTRDTHELLERHGRPRVLRWHFIATDV